MKRFLHNMLVTPEKTFPVLSTRPAAYFILYVLPAFLLLSMLSAIVVYSVTYLAWIIVLVGIIYLASLSAKGYQTSAEQNQLTTAQTQELPDVLIKYFKKQYPVSNLPMMLSDDRSHWVAYGHIDKNEMARAMTHLDYHLMAPPPEITDYFLKNTHKIEHAWLSVENPIKEKFRISTDPQPSDKPSYPVTVFDRSEK